MGALLLIIAWIVELALAIYCAATKQIPVGMHSIIRATRE